MVIIKLSKFSVVITSKRKELDIISELSSIIYLPVVLIRTKTKAYMQTNNKIIKIIYQLSKQIAALNFLPPHSSVQKQRRNSSTPKQDVE